MRRCLQGECCAYDVYKTMADLGVVSRYRGSETHCKGCIRVTVGTPQENNRFLELLQSTTQALVGC